MPAIRGPPASREGSLARLPVAHDVPLNEVTKIRVGARKGSDGAGGRSFSCQARYGTLPIAVRSGWCA